jgi:hypothetical protein
MMKGTHNDSGFGLPPQKITATASPNIHVAGTSDADNGLDLR